MDAEKSSEGRFIFDGEEYDLVEDLTLGESEELEEYATRDGRMLPMRSRTWLVWNTIRKRHPEVTIDAIRALPLSQLEEVSHADPPVQLPLADGSESGNDHESEETPATGGSQLSSIATD